MAEPLACAEVKPTTFLGRRGLKLHSPKKHKVVSGKECIVLTLGCRS